MELPNGLAMRHCDQCDALLLHIAVEVAFHVDSHCGGAFVQDRIHWLVVDQAAHRDALLLAS